MKELNNFDKYWQAPIACILVALYFAWVFRRHIGITIAAFLDLFEDHFDGKGEKTTVTRSVPFTEADFRRAERLPRTARFEVYKDMSKAAKAAIVTPESAKRDSIEEKPGVFAFEVDSTEEFKEREGIVNF